MRISVLENLIMTELQTYYPVASSVSKLVKATDRGRQEILDELVGLKNLTFISVTEKNEVYLLHAGKEYMGIPSNKPLAVCKGSTLPVQPLGKNNAEAKVETVDTGVASESPPANATIEESFAVLNKQLNAPEFVIDDAELKNEVLTRLVDLLDPSIGGVLLSIREDLAKVAA